MPPLISVIVPNYQGREIFPACIDSLRKQSYPRIQIVFCDDSSTDGSYELARNTYGKAITLTRTKQNSGFVGACNTALQVCKGTYICIVNNDATFPRNWMQEMYNTVKGKKRIIGGSLAAANKKEEAYLHRLLKQGIFGVNTLVGTMVSRSLTPMERKTGHVEMHALGAVILPRNVLTDYIYQHDYFAYGEDIELCWRLRLQGYHVVLNTKAMMRHYGSYTKKKVPTFNMRASYHGTRNQITNFFVLYEWQNVLKLAPWFFAMSFGRALARPSHWPQYAKAYCWVLFHLGTIYQRRKRMQRTRTVSDAEILRILSYRLHEVKKRSWRQLVVRGANACMRLYCKIVHLRTFDLNDDDAIPRIHEKAVS
ncbi:MAG: glycosyltransferase family 2 protein [Candidatus Woesearchaeota archaeon]|nr:glycosyltransferase family 2 protein [Candidatus Woesearchaeota archaeon]